MFCIIIYGYANDAASCYNALVLFNERVQNLIPVLFTLTLYY